MPGVRWCTNRPSKDVDKSDQMATYLNSRFHIKTVLLSLLITIFLYPDTNKLAKAWKLKQPWSIQHWCKSVHHPLWPMSYQKKTYRKMWPESFKTKRKGTEIVCQLSLSCHLITCSFNKSVHSINLFSFFSCFFSFASFLLSSFDFFSLSLLCFRWYY